MSRADLEVALLDFVSFFGFDDYREYIESLDRDPQGVARLLEARTEYRDSEAVPAPVHGAGR